MTETTQTSATRWRKKPVVVEARQLTTDNAAELWLWAGTSVGSNGIRDVTVNVDDGLTIDTLEGRMRADFGDWIVKGVKGEFYPCKPDIFEATYEPACRVCDGSGKLTVPDGDGESASEQACPDPIHDRQAAARLDDETPGYWHVRAALAISVHALQLVKLSDRDDLAKMAGETLAKVDAAVEAEPAPDPDSQQRYIDQLHDLVRDMLEAFPDTADEQEWRDRAGALYVCDPDGQPYRAYTEDDL